jgi:hypothetical protein
MANLQSSNLDMKLLVIIFMVNHVMQMFKKVVILLAKLPPIIKKYDHDDVFNFDDIGFYYIAFPCKTLNVGWPYGSKKKKYHVTLGPCVSTSHKDHLNIVFIHKLA